MLEKTLSQIKDFQKPEDQLVTRAQTIIQPKTPVNSKKKSELLCESGLNPQQLYNISNIRELALQYRLYFISDSQLKSEWPDIIKFKVEHYNLVQNKGIKNVYFLTESKDRNRLSNPYETLAFLKTEQGQFFLIHVWGKPYAKFRHWIHWPLKSAASFAWTIVTFTLMLALILPTEWITLDINATYWSGYRLGTFFHLLIFNTGFGVFSWMAFTKGFSKSVWDHVSS